LESNDKARRLVRAATEFDVRIDPDVLFMHAPEDVMCAIRDAPNIVDPRVFRCCIGGALLHWRFVQ
jgi:hypothetical protein